MEVYTEFLIRIIICFLLSFCIGIERQYRRRAIGLRTVILVSLGSFLFVRFSFNFPGSDTTSIAAQVVAGIGFLGAGVIIKDGKTVKGLTTSATLWCAAAIGILTSAGLLFEAAVGTLLILFTNIVLRTINTKINRLSGNLDYIIYSFSITCEERIEDEILKIIKKIAKNNHSIIKNINNNETESGNIKINIDILIDQKNDTLTNEIMQKLANKKDIISISLNKKDKNYLYEEEEL